MILNDKIYTVLKWVNIIFLPAFITLFYTVGGIWKWEYTDAITATLTAVEVFIGAVIGVSAINLKKQDSGYEAKHSDESKS